MRKFILGFLTAAIIAVFSVVVPSAIVNAFDQAEYTANGRPQFNVYTDVLNIGNEKDFVRVGPVGGTGSQFSNDQAACEGDVKINVYVHNGAPEGFNGTNNDGTGVARDTKVKVLLPTTAGKNQKVSSTISASNAFSVSDDANISCAGQDIQLEYVANSANIVSEKSALRKLDNAIVKDGALIGTVSNDGVVPGCWESRNYITLIVHVKKVSKPVVTPATCDLLDATIDKRVVTVKGVQYTLNDATLNSVVVNFGDGTVSTIDTSKLPVTHTYSKDGEFVVAATVNTTLDGNKKAAVCKKTVKATTPTVVLAATTTPTPTALPNTGPGDVVGMFAAITIVGAVAHKFLFGRLFN